MCAASYTSEWLVLSIQTVIQVESVTQLTPLDMESDHLD